MPSAASAASMIISGFGFVAGRVGGVDPDEIYQVVDCFLAQFIPVNEVTVLGG